MMPMPITKKFNRRGSMPGRLRRASLSAGTLPEQSAPMMMPTRSKKGSSSRLMLSWFQASETVEEVVDERQEAVASPSTVSDDSPSEAPIVEHVEITGLELLKKNAKFKEESDDFSYDSYARDSFVLAGKKVKKVVPKPPPGLRLVQSEHPQPRKIDMEEDEDEVDSMARDYYDYDYDYRTADLEKEIRRWTPRRQSIESYVDSYVGSYANDSVEFARYKTTRRASIGSYANDSMGYKNTRSSRGGANALGVSWHGQNKYGRLNSLGGRRASTGRRNSLGRRSSLGSQTSSTGGGNRLACRGGVMRRHSSHCAELGMMRKGFEGPSMMRRSSLGSVSSGVSLSVATSLSMSTAFSRAA